MEGRKVFILIRTFKFKGGTTVQVPMSTYGDKLAASREADKVAASLQDVDPAIVALFGYLGIAEIGHVIMETPLHDGTGLVLVGANSMPPPPLAG